MSDVVAITGVGIACALGCDRATVTSACRAGTRPFAPIRRFDASAYRVNRVAEVPHFDAAGRFGRRALRRTSRTDQLALWAAADAIGQADLRRDIDLAAAGVFVGASSGGMGELEDCLEAKRSIPAAVYWSYPVWATANAMQRVLGLRGPRATYMTACSSAAHAIGIAMQRIRRGDLAMAIAGGAEALSRLTLSGFGSLGVLDPDGTRPFAIDRQGITLGEGAAFLVLEPLAHARARGARVLAVVAGYGASADAHHMVQPRDDGAGALLAMRRALDDAGATPDAVDYINAHGTGTRQNDAMEARAIAALAPQAAVSSSKSMVGHTLGAAAAVEAALCVLAMDAGFVPPNPGVGEALPEIGSAQLARAALPRRPNVVLSSSFAFGGNNAALVVCAPEHAPAARRPAARRVLIAGAAVACRRGTANLPAELVALPGRSGTNAVAASELDAAVARRMDRFSQLVLSTAQNALQSAGAGASRELGVGVGTSFGALDETGAFLQRLFEKGPRLVNPMAFPNLVHNAAAGYVSIALGAEGPQLASCQEELAGDEALRAFFEALHDRRLDKAVVVGGDLASTALDAGYRAVGRHSGALHADVFGAVVLTADDGSASGARYPWARVLASSAEGPGRGVAGAIETALTAAQRTAASVDHWVRTGVQRGAASPPVSCGCTALTEVLGDAGGAGVAGIAFGAALVADGRASVVLVTAEARDGAAHATLLGLP